MRNILFLSLFIFISTDVFTSEHQGLVTRVIDGDSIILNINNTHKKIRLLHIDAPEIKQQFGKISKKFLEDLVLNKKITIDISGKDIYGRHLAELYMYGDDKSININAKMIKSGHAWVYKLSRKNPYLINLENHARSNKLGLWHIHRPLEPWLYRSYKK